MPPGNRSIILKDVPLGEADRLVSFFGRTSGASAEWLRCAEAEKRYGSSLELLSHVKIWYVEKRRGPGEDSAVRTVGVVHKHRDYDLARLAVVSEISERFCRAGSGRTDVPAASPDSQRD